MIGPSHARAPSTKHDAVDQILNNAEATVRRRWSIIGGSADDRPGHHDRAELGGVSAYASTAERTLRAHDRRTPTRRADAATLERVGSGPLEPVRRERRS